MQVRMNPGNRVVDWIWRLCNMVFESDVLEDWRSAMIVSLYKGKEEKTMQQL